jgi:hypothetical protein
MLWFELTLISKVGLVMFTKKVSMVARVSPELRLPYLGSCRSSVIQYSDLTRLPRKLVTARGTSEGKLTLINFQTPDCFDISSEKSRQVRKDLKMSPDKIHRISRACESCNKKKV